MHQNLAFLPIAEKIEWLKQHNAAHSKAYCSPDQELSRQLYLAQHPTRIAAFKCMDGRINLPIVTSKPFGIIDPFRNLAGRFDLGWPYLGELFQEWVENAVGSGRQCLVLVTYHFSESDNSHRGCAGFDYDKDRAFAFMARFKQQIERVFGYDHQVVYPLIVGLETDTDTLSFHGADDSLLDLSKVTNPGGDYLTRELVRLYPDMPERMLYDLVPLALGNLQHIVEVAAERRPIVEAEHREWVLGIGRGFDWLHEPNLALLVGPYSPNLDEPIKMALSIIGANMDRQRISDDGFVLLTSAPYSRQGADKQRAREKAQFLSAFAREVAARHYPELSKIMNALTVVLDQNNRRFEILAGA
jgi:hypothetical protein